MNIRIVDEKKLIGVSCKMSFANNKAQELWKRFMPRKKEIQNTIGIELYSGEVYPNDFFINFNPHYSIPKMGSCGS